MHCFRNPAPIGYCLFILNLMADTTNIIQAVLKSLQSHVSTLYAPILLYEMFLVIYKTYFVSDMRPHELRVASPSN